MPLIKAIHAPTGLSAFTMRDVEDQARAIIARAQQQAEQILAAARTEGEVLKHDAKAQGFTEGRRQGIEEGQKTGHEQALEENRAQLANVVKSLNAAMTQMNSSRQQLEAAAVHELVELAIAIARRVTKRQGMIDPGVLAANIAEAMKLVVHSSDVRLAIHPSQRKALADELPRLQLDWPSLEHVELIEDASIAPGGCRVFTRQGHIDGDLEAQLDRVVADLLPAGQEASA